MSARLEYDDRCRLVARHPYPKTVVPVQGFADVIGGKWISRSLGQRLIAAEQYLLDAAAKDYNRSLLKPTWIYVAEAVGIPFLKIGMSKSVSRRWADLNRGFPVEVKIDANFVGTVIHERALHHAFSDTRARCEWFHRNYDLLELASLLGDRDMLEHDPDYYPRNAPPLVLEPQ